MLPWSSLCMRRCRRGVGRAWPASSRSCGGSPRGRPRRARRAPRWPAATRASAASVKMRKPSSGRKPWISRTSSAAMNSRISALITCPGTRIGKPGGYGITKIAETRSRAGLDRPRRLVPCRGTRRLVVVGEEEGAADVAVAGLGPALDAAAAEREMEAGEVGQRRLLRVSERTRFSWMRRSIALMSATRSSTSRAIFISTSIR